MASLSITANQSFNFTVGQYSTVSVSYSYTGSKSLVWKAVGLPVGLSINNGIISGTPTIVGKRPAYVYVSDSELTAGSIVNINVKKVSNLTNKIIVSPSNSGYAGITTFQFTGILIDSLLGSSVSWDFGDGVVVKDTLTPTHSYKLPGKYTVVLKIVSDGSGSAAVSCDINIGLLLNESIYFDYVPPPAFAGHINRYPFVLSYTSSTSGSHAIDLGAQFSRSYQTQNPRNKWSFLRPEWRFLDLDLNPITSITPSETPIYVDNFGTITNDPVNGFFAGVTGTASFYFVDDVANFDLVASNLPYTTLIATLQTSAIRSQNDGFQLDLNAPGYSNSLATVSQPYMVLWRNPDNISIKENGIRNYSNPRWYSANQPIIATTNFTKKYPDPWIDGNGVSFWNPSFSFCHNIPFLSSSINLKLGLETLSAVFQPSDLSFRWIDNTGYKVPGYYKGSFVALGSTTMTDYVTGSLSFTTPVLSSQYSNPYLWISNPNAGMMTLAQYIAKENNSLSAVFDTPNMNIAQVHNFNMPIITSVDFSTNAMAMTGFHGINSIASLPAPDYHAWALDSEMNYLYRLNTMGTILCAIDINNIVAKNNLGFLVPNQVSPANIALDSKQNIWVTLYDSISTLKFDSMGNFLFATTPLSVTGYQIPPKDLEWFAQSSYYLYDPTAPNDWNQINDNSYNLIEPTGIDTDTNNNAWVTYSNYTSGALIKYDQNGNVIYSYMYPVCSCPQSLVVDNQNNIWVALSNSIWQTYGRLEKRNSNGVLLSSFGPIMGLNKLTLDYKQNPWFTYSYSWIGNIDNKTSTVTTINLSGDYYTKNHADWFNSDLNTDETALEGIGCDLYGRVYVINSVENQIYVLNSDTKKSLNKFHISPQGFSFFMDDQSSSTNISVNIWDKSAQADGDWTGLRWYLKYGNTIPEFSTSSNTFSITGISSPLHFANFSENDAFKKNENFDLASTMKSYVFSPALFEKSDFLFDSFLGSIYGKYPFNHSDIGVTLYEKIANFVPNTSDIDYCNVHDLYSHANMINIEMQDFNLSYPVEVERILDFASINLSRLMGAKSLEQSSFAERNKNNHYNMIINPIQSLNYKVTAGIPLVLKDKSIEQYRLLTTGYINCSSTYLLSDLANFIGFTGSSWMPYYEFHEFVPEYEGTQLAGIIDWNSPQTTIKQTLSTENDWFGAGGYLDTQFSYELYKGLGLLKN